MDLGLDPGMMAMDNPEGYTAVFFAKGYIGGQYYSGIITMGEEQEPHPLGKNAVAIDFGEADPPQD